MKLVLLYGGGVDRGQLVLLYGGGEIVKPGFAVWGVDSEAGVAGMGGG